MHPLRPRITNQSRAMLRQLLQTGQSKTNSSVGHRKKNHGQQLSVSSAVLFP